MAPVAIPYLWINPGRRGPAAYFRRGRVTVRIRDAAGNALLPGMPGFLAAFEATRAAFSAEPTKAATGPAPGSLAALIVAYTSSPEWRNLAPATQDDYNKAFFPLLDRFGVVPVVGITRAFVFKLRDKFATADDGTATPRRANRMVSTLRLLLAWGVNRGWRSDNPAINPGQLQTGPGYATWSPDEFAQFMAAEVGEPIRRAAALGYYTGQRKQDCLSATKTARTGGGIEFTPAKTARSTKATLWIPEAPELTRILDAAPPSDAVTLLTRPDGRPWKEDNFNHVFADAVRLAGLPAGHGFHGLRKAMAVNLAAGGATDAEMDAVVYHADPKMTRLYRAGANQRTLAAAGMAKLTKGKP